MNCIQKLMARGLSRSQARDKCNKARRNHPHMSDDCDEFMDVAFAVVLLSTDIGPDDSFEEPTTYTPSSSFDDNSSSDSYDSSSDSGE